MPEITLEFDNAREMRALFGDREGNISHIENLLGVTIVPRANFIKVSGAAAGLKKCEALFHELQKAVRAGRTVSESDLNYAVRELSERGGGRVQSFLSEKIRVSSKRGYITPKTRGQYSYVRAMREYDIVFGIGPAGTGKTYLAMAMAVEALLEERVSRIILTRPAVEAGESLGYLPGDLYEKITPYLRPLYDALYDMMDPVRVQSHIERGIIEVAPLAYMRGRTLNDAFIILDEAQNSTIEQMKMFLTRLGFDSRVVVTGDITQVDLPGNRQSGLIHARDILKRIQGMRFVSFTGRDVVRHELVRKIIRAYEKNSNSD